MGFGVRDALSTPFLVVFLPVALLVLALILGIFAHQERQNAMALDRERIEAKAQAMAVLLADSVWPELASRSEAASALNLLEESAEVHCVLVEGEEGWFAGLRAGECGSTSPDGFLEISAPIEIEHRELGKVVVRADISDGGWGSVREAGHVLVLVGLLLAMLVGGGVLAFQRAVAGPVRDFFRVRSELVEREKYATLGRQAPAVAHEISTPIGNSVMVAELIQERSRDLGEALQSDGIRKSDLNQFLGELGEAARVLERNLVAAREQVARFKQVSVDLGASHCRRFDLKELVDDVLAAMRFRFRDLGPEVEVSVDVPEGVTLESYPGPLAQVIRNALDNSLLHGLEGIRNPRLTIRAQRDSAGRVLLQLIDNGRGMSPKEQKCAFEPFFTTCQERGGAGLGLHIIEEQVIRVLQGSLTLETKPGEGVKISILLPEKVAVEEARRNINDP